MDRGVVVSAALSTGEMLTCPQLSPLRQRRLQRLQRKLARARRGSNRRAQVKCAVARLSAREADARKDWVEKLSTDLARRFDVICVEDLRMRDITRSAKGTIAEPGRNVRAKAGLNRQILTSGWGILVRRLEEKAPGRVMKIHPAYTSQRCSACGHVAGENRKSQAVFACTACRYTANADVNAAINIAAGHAVTARGGLPLGRPTNREPQIAPIHIGERLESSYRRGGCQVLVSVDQPTRAAERVITSPGPVSAGSESAGSASAGSGGGRTKS